MTEINFGSKRETELNDYEKAVLKDSAIPDLTTRGQKSNSVANELTRSIVWTSH